MNFYINSSITLIFFYINSILTFFRIGRYLGNKISSLLFCFTLIYIVQSCIGSGTLIVFTPIELNVEVVKIDIGFKVLFMGVG